MRKAEGWLGYLQHVEACVNAAGSLKGISELALLLAPGVENVQEALGEARHGVSICFVTEETVACLIGHAQVDRVLSIGSSGTGLVLAMS